MSLFEITRAISFIFPKILDAILRITINYVRQYYISVSSLNHIFESENLKFPFSTKNILTWEVKYVKNKFQKIVGIYKISFENYT